VCRGTLRYVELGYSTLCYANVGVNVRVVVGYGTLRYVKVRCARLAGTL
jgi:hypothetical protein